MFAFKVRHGLLGWEFHLALSSVLLLMLVLASLSLLFIPQIRPHPMKAPSVPVESAHNSDVLASFYDAGLYADVIRGASKDERDGMWMFNAVETTRFRISAEENEPGMIIRFHNSNDLKRMEDYYRTLNKSLSRYSSRIFVEGNILLQINSEVPERIARQYQAALYSPDDY